MPKNPYAIRLPAAQHAELTTKLVEELRSGKRARDLHMSDNGLIDFYYSLYEQQSQRGISRDTQRYGEADLTSPIATENVDSLTARATHTLFKQEPVWMVEGIGDSAQKAPIVEAFLQLRQERMRFQKTAKRAITSSFVETGSILEVCDDTEPCERVYVAKAQPRQAPDGTVELDPETGQPYPTVDEIGDPVEVEQGAEAYVEVKQTWTDYRRRGAYVRSISMKDFLFLPSHARDDREVWGHATRFYLTEAEILRKVKAKQWKTADVEKIAPGTQEREQRSEHDRAGVTVEQTTSGFKGNDQEFWRVQCWVEVPGKQGLRCIIAIVSEIHSVILEVQEDWLGAFRTVLLAPYPCPYSVYPYSLVGTKLLTTELEHTAWRNMNADRDTLEANAPLKVRRGSGFDPALQPFGAGRTVMLDNMDDVMPFEFKGSSVQALNKEAQCVTDAQRIVGLNDIAIGQQSKTDRTLGENKMATTQSFVRTDDPISNLNEAFEEVGWLIHAIEQQALKDREAGEGIDATDSVMQSVKRYDPAFQGTFTSDMVDGDFLFKLRGSTDMADPQARLQRAEAMFATMANYSKVNPLVAQRMASPEMEKAMMQMVVDEFKPRNTKAFLDPLQPPPMMGMEGMPGDPMAAGAPPGGPPPAFGGQVLNELLAQLPPGVQ